MEIDFASFVPLREIYGHKVVTLALAKGRYHISGICWNGSPLTDDLARHDGRLLGDFSCRPVNAERWRRTVMAGAVGFFRREVSRVCLSVRQRPKESGPYLMQGLYVKIALFSRESC